MLVVPGMQFSETRGVFSVFARVCPARTGSAGATRDPDFADTAQTRRDASSPRIYAHHARAVEFGNLHRMARACVPGNRYR